MRGLTHWANWECGGDSEQTEWMVSRLMNNCVPAVYRSQSFVRVERVGSSLCGDTCLDGGGIWQNR